MVWEQSNAKMRGANNNLYEVEEGKDKGSSPDIGVPLHIEVVEVVGALSSTKVWSLQPLDDLGFHHPGYVSRQ